jgi:hypothetical protein
MAYIFDPLRNTFIDDEDTSLGNKLALLDDDLEKAIRELNEKFGPDTIKTLDQLPENKPTEVEDTERFNRFNRMYEDGGMVRQEFAPKNKIRLAGTTTPGKYEVQAASSKWLQNYSYADLLSDLEKGLSKMEIAKNVYQNNKQLYDSIPIEEEKFLKMYNNVEDAKVAKIANSIKNRLDKKPELKKLNEKNTATLKKLENSVVKDVDKWIKNNKSKYVGKQGAYKLFETDLFKFLEKDYSRLIKTAKGISESTIAGDKFISKFANKSGYASSTDEGANYRAVKKKLYKALGIDFGKDMTRETTKQFTKTTNAVKKLLPIAQEKGIIPKTYMGGKANNKVIKITPQNYFEYLKQTQTDPMKKIFNNLLNFSVEHPGGLSRAAELLDSESLGKIIPLEYGDFGENIKGKKMSANLVKGQKYDSQITKFIKKAKFEATNLSQAKNFLKQANAISKKAANEFGTLQSTYTAVKGGDGKIQIKVKHPNISLNDSLVSKTKNAIHSFIANDGMNREVFNELPSKLKKAVTLISQNKSADSILKSHIKDIFPEEGKGIKMGSFAGVIDFDMIPDDLKATVAKGASALGKSLRVLGLATAPLDVFPFSEQSAKGLTGTDLLKTGGSKLIESYLNAPQSIASLFGKELYEPFTFGTEYADKIEASIPMEERILNQKNLAFDKTMPTFVDDIDIAPSREELKKMRKDFIEDVDIDTSKNLPFVPLEEKDTELSPIIKSLVAPDQTLQDFMANGGRVNFNSGGAAGADDDFAAQLEYFFLNPDAELPAAQTFKETMNPISIVNDMIDPRNIPYYADRLVESGIRIGEFGARVLPAVGKLAADLIQKPAFKIKPAEGQGYVQDYADIPPSNITGTGIFSEFLNNLVGSEGTKAITEKTGLAKLIKDEEQKMKDERKTAGAKILADQVTLGMELTAPIFPGLKLLKAYAKNRNLPVDKTTREIMDKEIDEVLTKQGISRRDFMKVAGAGGAVAIAKLLGIGDDLATVTKVAEKAVPKGPIVPPYFFTLVDKIKRLGTDESKRFATMDREVVYVYKNYELYEDLSTGNIRINKKSGDPDFAYVEEEMVYTKGIGDESTQGTPPDEYDEFTVRPDEDGKMKDVDSGLDDIEELIDEVGVENISIKDLEAMGYEIDRLPVSTQRKLGIQKPISPIDRALKNSDDDLPDLPF